MAAFMRRYEGETYALKLIVVGFLFLWHGMQKLFLYIAAHGAGRWSVDGSRSAA